MAGGQVLDAELGRGRKSRLTSLQQALDRRVGVVGQIAFRRGQAAIAGAAAGEHAVEVPMGLGVARLGIDRQGIVEGLVGVDAVFIAGFVDALLFAEGTETFAGGAGIRHGDIGQTLADDAAELGVEPGNAADLAVIVGVGLIGVIGVVLVPGLVGQAHRGVVLEMVLELNLHMVGVVAERGIARARIAVVIAADGKRRILDARDRRRIPHIDTAVAIGRPRDAGDAAGFVEIQLARDEVDRGAGRVRGQDARAAAFQRFDMIDRDVVLEHFVIVQAAIDGRHAVLDQADESLAAARQAAHRVIVGDRAGGAFDEDAGNHFQHVVGAARRLLVEVGAVDRRDRDRGVQHGALGGRAGDHDGLQLVGSVIGGGRRRRDLGDGALLGGRLDGAPFVIEGAPDVFWLHHQHARGAGLDGQIRARQQRIERLVGGEGPMQAGGLAALDQAFREDDLLRGGLGEIGQGLGQALGRNVELVGLVGGPHGLGRIGQAAEIGDTRQGRCHQ